MKQSAKQSLAKVAPLGSGAWREMDAALLKCWEAIRDLTETQQAAVLAVLVRGSLGAPRRSKRRRQP